MLTEEAKQKILEAVKDELTRVNFGKIILELGIKDGRVINFNTETRKSINIYQK